MAGPETYLHCGIPEQRVCKVDRPSSGYHHALPLGVTMTDQAMRSHGNGGH